MLDNLKNKQSKIFIIPSVVGAAWVAVVIECICIHRARRIIVWRDNFLVFFPRKNIIVNFVIWPFVCVVKLFVFLRKNALREKPRKYDSGQHRPANVFYERKADNKTC